MALISPLVDYSDKDYSSLRRRLRNLIRSVFPEWTDHNVANFGNILVELFAHTGDILLFYQDNQARQSRITSGTQRRALLGLVKLIGYTPSTATAATADLVVTIPIAAAGSVTFPSGSFVKTEEVTDPIRYQLLTDAIIEAGQTSVTVSAENSETREESFIFNGLPLQKVALAATPYIDGTATLTASNGAYVQVDNFLDSGPADRHYVVEVDQNDRATFKFGNGVNGASPTGAGTVTYRIGGGAAGRVEMNKLRVFEQSQWSDSFGNSVAPSVTNPTASSGGTDRQSVAQIKERGPASLRALTRSVAREDFEIHSLRLPGVARALMLTSNEDASVLENTGHLYIIPVGGGLPSQTIKDDVLRQVTVVYPCTLTFQVFVKDPVFRTIGPSMIVYFQSGVNKVKCAASIRTNLTNFFNVQNADGSTNTLIDFGANIKKSDGTIVSELAISDVLNVVRDTSGVRKVPIGDFLLDGSNEDVPLAPKEFPKLGIVTIIDGDTGTSL